MNKDLEARIRKEGLDPADFQKAWDKLAEYYKELAKRKEECKRNGNHLKPNTQSIGYMPVARAWVYCEYCNAHYTRPLNAQESREMNKIMNTPIY